MRLASVLVSPLCLLVCSGVPTTVAARGPAFQARPRARLLSAAAAAAPTPPGLAARHRDGDGTSAPVVALLRLRGGVSDVTAREIVGHSYDWLMNLGAPAALVAGAVIASIYEFNRNDTLELERRDTKLVRFAKKVSKMMLVWAFALELLSIFVVMVMGTVLMGKTIPELASIKITPHTTPISFLRENFEFEYLTARVTFLVGLLSWLSAIALHFLIPSGIETQATRVMDKLITSILATIIVLMVSFYNQHVIFYANIGSMIFRYKVLIVQNYLAAWPPRPLSLALYPCVGATLYYMYQTFCGGLD